MADYHEGSLARGDQAPGQGRHLLLARRDYRPIPRRARPYRYVAICNDITRRKRARRHCAALEGLANLKFAAHDEVFEPAAVPDRTPTTRGVPSPEG